MKRRALTMVELVVTVAVMSILMGGLLSAFSAIAGVQTFTTTMPTVQDTAQRMTRDVAAAFRKATLATSADSGCTLNAAVENVSSSAATIYSGSNGSIVKTTYANSGSDVVKSTGASPATVWYANASLSFTYYTSATYHGSAITAYTPSSGTTPQLIAVGITGTYTSGGITASYSTLVRLRNGPLKTSLSD
jgi:hypothetical protein